ncbi:MAG TPA: preprotein translocase subunit SecE [Steroidobacteraceae bacterium]|jgi:preprotein translocase subunit SecE|nr:preprotein translocase subunit SecE [Steroidobacteraceae bacterium]
MNDAAQQQSVGGSVDAVKLVVAVLLVLAGIVAFYVLQTQADWLRWGAVAVGIVLALVVFGSSARGRAVWQFVLDSRQELRKVAWPTRQETAQTTLVVFVFVVVVGVFFWALDLFLSWATRFLTGGG